MYKRILSTLLASALTATMVVGSVSAAFAAEDSVYIVAGTAELLGSKWDGTDANNKMTKDGDVYKLTINDVAVGSDYQLKVVENGSNWYGDASGNNITFDVTVASDVTVSYAPDTHAIKVTGTGVKFKTGLDISKICAVGNGDGTWLNGVSWKPDADANKMTEVSPNVYQITFEDVEEFDNYQIKFAANGSWADNWGLESSRTINVGKDENATYNGQNIVVDVPYELADVTFTLDLNGFDYATKKGGTIKCEVVEASAQPTTAAPTTAAATTAAPTTAAPTTAAPTTAAKESGYSLVGTMNSWKDGANKLYYTTDEEVAQTVVTLDAGTYEFKLRNGSTWYGNGGTIVDTTTATSKSGWTMSTSDGNCKLQATGGTYTFAFNTSTKKLHVYYEPVTEPTTAAPTTAAPTTAAPTTAAPTTAAPTTAAPTTAAPTTAAPTTAAPTTAAPTTAEPTEAPTTAAPTTAEPTTAAPTIPEADVLYVVAGSAELLGESWVGTPELAPANIMKDNGNGTFSLTVSAEAGNGYQVKVVENTTEEQNWYGDPTGNNITFNVTKACNVTITFNADTKAITVTGDGVQFVTDLKIEAMRAVGNGDGAWLNDVNWDPADDANLMTKVVEGVYSITFESVEEFDNYMVKFAANGAWADNWGLDAERAIAIGTEETAVYNGQNCIVEVPYELATVTLTLDLRDFDYATKTGGTIFCTVEEQKEEPTEPTTVAPTTAAPTTTAPVTEPTTAADTTVAPVASGFSLVGSMNSWDAEANKLCYTEDKNLVKTEVTLEAGTYEFKIRNGNTWYGNNGTIVDTTTATSEIGWEMTTSADNCKLGATGGKYTFIFNETNNMLVINYEPVVEPTTAEPTEAPTTAAPTTAEPTEAPTTAAPTTAEPTEAPTTAEPTEAPTTAAPTTAEPTETPTTVAPTTVEPTTAAPTTVEPTTAEPTQAPTTEPKPTEPASEIVCVVAGSAELLGQAWNGDAETAPENVMTDNGNGTYTLVVAAQPGEGYQLKIVVHDGINQPAWIGDKTGNNITFNVTKACDVTITFDINTMETTVTGEGVEFVTDLEIKALYAVGNGDGTWLNDAIWDPSAEANIMTEVEPGVYTITFDDIEEFDNYQIKFAANGSWTDSWGVGAFCEIVFGESVDAVYNGENIVVDVPYELATVTCTVDLRDFNYATKTGGTIKVEVTEKGEPTPVKPNADINRDGSINVKDVTTLQRYLAKIDNYPEGVYETSDLNGDGKVDVKDATYLQIFLSERY